MKTIVCHEPGVMTLEKVKNPSLMKQDSVKIAIKRIGICGTDLHAYAGNQPFFDYPRILGHELAGVVVEKGAHVSNVEIGDIVTVIPYIHCGTCISCRSGKTNCCTQMQVLGVHIDGGMCEELIVPSSYVISTQTTLDEASIIEPLSIGAHAVRRAQIQQGETVLIIGAGPIGLGVAAFAKEKGAKTILLDLNEERLRFAKDWAHADEVLLPSEDNECSLRGLNNDELPTIVFDATGNQNSMTEAFKWVAHGGKLVYVGLVKEHITFFDPDFHARELTLFASRNATKEDFDTVMAALSSKKIDANAYITKRITFEETITYFNDKNYQINKAVICL
ncbi:zinc-binding alcohol dehydrogenase family protein [Aneurinibacillus aneurinilyticus]|uniref:zinc-binding alcohol dehydrogenase family protein n=1 Tax=Aneurinibacillus aneurinilyticus TaxID=1391 RepID=UPI002E2062F4|nr:zinc-binding alcohol dehydrogenase family protein [Aneurinibacillus aneurinilyticus]